MTDLRIQLLNSFVVTVDNVPVAEAAWRGQRTRLLLQFLASRPHGHATSDELIDALWEHPISKQARHSLHVAISRLRQALASTGRVAEGAELVVATPTGYRLAPGTWVDVTVLGELVRTVRDLQAKDVAAARARLDAAPWDRFPEFHVGQPYADWAIAARERLRHDFVALQLLRGDLWLSGGQPELAMAALQQVLEIDPLMEPAARQAMLIAYEQGNQALALSIFDRLRRGLLEELGTSPLPETLDLHTRILAQDRPDADPAPGPGPGNLPLPLTRCFGRQHELAAISRHLRSSRLLTLTGPGGVGKTRLAQEAAALADEFSDGVWFVDLAPLSDPALVPVAALEALGLREQAQRLPVHALREHLASRQTLVVLDNCEHLVGACAALARELLQACPRLCLLATSREPLRVAGEVVLPLAGLPVPAADGAADLADLQEIPSVSLFLDRAGTANPALAPADLDAASLASICRRLDGLPLALELAAARTRVLTVAQIAQRLDNRFGLLTDGDRLAPLRQQTLRAAIDWSHDLLSPQEQVLLRRLSVFAGGATLELAEAVCAGGEVSASEILDLLGRLVDRSLVVAEQRGATMRYRLLETIRQYATAKLQTAGEQAELATRHLACYATLAEEGELESLAPGQQAWFARLREELDNIRTALAWSLTSGSPADGLRLAASLALFWYFTGHLREGRQVLATLLARPDAPAGGRLRARALLAAATVAFYQADHAVASELSSQALSWFRGLDDSPRTHACLSVLGWATMRCGNLAAARRHLEEAVSVAAPPRLFIPTLEGLGRLYSLLGEHERAEAVLATALAAARAQGNPNWVAMALIHLSGVAAEQGHYLRAEGLLTEAIALSGQLDDEYVLALAISTLARVAQGLGRSQQAARLFGAAAALRERVATAHVGADLVTYEASLATCRAHLGEAAFARQYEMGSRLSREQVLALAAQGQPDSPADAGAVSD